MKKLISLALALIMIMSLSVTAFAATNGKITNTTNREYKAYQIFSGTQSANSAVLGDIAWGSGITSAEFLTDLKDLEIGENMPFAACTDAASVAAVLAGNADDSDIAKAFANLAVKFVTGEGTTIAANESEKVLPSGYYLLVDQTNVSTGHVAKNAALLQITNESNLKIKEKLSVPTVEKYVTTKDKVADDFNIGDEITFILEAKLGNDLTGYDSYKIVFNDTLSAGLDYAANVVVMVDNVAKTDKFATSYNESDRNLTISCNDVLALGAKKDSEIIVTYKAKLNANAVVGTAGNPNEVYLEYSNNPNWTGTPTEEPTGETPKKEVKVYTWDMGVLKYADGDTTKTLSGVKFILLNKDLNKIAKVADGKIVSWETYNEGMKVTDYELTTGEDGTIHIDGLDTGTYYLRETYALPGYNKLTADIEANVTVKTDGSYATYVAEINNNSGTELPSTGGMGTTLFYILGGLMVLGAVVILVTKKRMGAAE